MNTKYGMAAAATLPVVLFAGIYVVTRSYWVKKKHNKARTGHLLTRSMSIGVLHGGTLALQRLDDYCIARADPKVLDSALCDLRDIVAHYQQGLPQHPQLWRLQNIVAKLEMSGKEAEAVQILEDAVEKAHKELRMQEAYELEMSLVELLIYKGEYGKANDRQCLNNEEISDARRPLYKAIILLMLNQSCEAKNQWDKFKKIRKYFQLPPNIQESKLYEAMKNFSEFEKVVNLLKNDIDKARANTTNE